MKPTNTLALSIALTAVAVILPPALTPAEEKPPAVEPVQQKAEIPEAEKLPPRAFDIERLPQRGKHGLELELDTLKPPAPVVPEGAKMTEELESTIALINIRLLQPAQSFSNRRVFMTRAGVRMDVHYAMAITDTSDSLFPFDIYQCHRRGEWTKVASGVCHPGMESLKLANPETGAMEEPIKHPLFAIILTQLKAAEEAS